MRTVNQERFQARRRHVREAALACFKRRGFHQASMADICAEAKMSPGNLYRYYDSKEAIIAAICEEDRQGVIERLAAIGERPNLLEAMLEMAGEELGAGDPEKRKFGTEVLAEAARNAVIAEIVRRHNSAIVGICAEAIRRAQAVGQVDGTLDPRLAAAILVAAAEGLSTQLALGSAIDAREHHEAFKLLMLRFLSPAR
jgi:TetR/AcrR family transcriptional regulator, repressor for uid operon